MRFKQRPTCIDLLKEALVLVQSMRTLKQHGGEGGHGLLSVVTATSHRGPSLPSEEAGTVVWRRREYFILFLESNKWIAMKKNGLHPFTKSLGSVLKVVFTSSIGRPSSEGYIQYDCFLQTSRPLW